MNRLRRARTVAGANIALTKYWGKLPDAGNYPAVPSLSLTLDRLQTTTQVEFSPDREADEVVLNSQPVAGRSFARVVGVLNRMRVLAGTKDCARVDSVNAFPTAAGLASSSSGFAALVVACNAALGLELSPADLGRQARLASASAARSLHGGWAELLVGAEAASSVAQADHWDLALIVAVVARGPKSIGSTEAMNLTRATSPYYLAWVEQSPALHRRARSALLERNLTQLGELMEQSTWLMHATLLSTVPPIRYLAPVTLAVLDCVVALRQAGIEAYATMDAGPNVKILTRASDAARVVAALRAVAGVDDTMVCRPGEAAHVIDGGRAES